jgi:hypothetical protein
MEKEVTGFQIFRKIIIRRKQTFYGKREGVINRHWYLSTEDLCISLALG